jgi:hypothetical protein
VGSERLMGLVVLSVGLDKVTPELVRAARDRALRLE